MAMTTFDTSERQEIEELLPWYVTGRLSASDHDRVAAYLEQHPDVKTSIAIAHEEASSNAAANLALPAPSADALARLMRSLPGQSEPATVTPSWFERLAARLSAWVASLSPGQLGMAAAALITLFLAQAVTIGTLIGDRSGVYQTATGPNEPPPANAVELLIGFKAEATMAETSAFLKDNGLTLIDGPRAGLYRVRATGSAPAPELAARLKSAPVVATVLPGR
jgi:hypothetical protein